MEDGPRSAKEACRTGLWGRWSEDALGGGKAMETIWPRCQKCGTGVLVPLSDYGQEGAPVPSKARVRTHPACGFNLKIHKGNLYINEPVSERPLYDRL